MRNHITAFALLMCCFMKSTRVSGVKNIAHGVSRHMRSIGFPEGSTAEIFFALGVPIDIPDKSISMSFYFEANYGLPYEWNSTYYFYEGSYFVKRSLSRQLVYDLFTSKLENFPKYELVIKLERLWCDIMGFSLSYPGQDCLLKIICQTAKYSLSENGVLGDILQIVFTPSMSRSEDLPNEITEAEHEQLCDQRYENCSINPLDLVTQYVN